MAIRRPDQETIEALTWLTQLHEEWHLAIFERCEATLALRSLGRWPEVIESPSSDGVSVLTWNQKCLRRAGNSTIPP